MPDNKPQIQKDLERDYRFSKNYDLHVTVSPGKMPYYAETFKPGDKDNPEEGYIRPPNTPLNSLGVEIYKPNKFSHHDLAGELLHADPVANRTREYLQNTLTPSQFEVLKSVDDYKFPEHGTAQGKAFEKATTEEGLTPDQKRLNNATDSFIRGYTVGQWPKDAIKDFGLSVEQKQKMDNLHYYMVHGEDKQAPKGILAKPPAEAEK